MPAALRRRAARLPAAGPSGRGITHPQAHRRAARRPSLRTAGLAHRTFETGAQAVLAAGCRPRFADVLPDCLLLDPRDAELRIRKRTAALLAVHLYGQPASLTELSKLARRRGIALLQDACQAHGAQSDGRPFTRFSRAVA